MLLAGLGLLILGASAVVGLFPSRATVVALVYGLAVLPLLLLQRRLALTGPIWRRGWGETLCVRLVATVVFALNGLAVEYVLLVLLLARPWVPPVETACLCSDATGLRAALCTGAIGFALFNLGALAVLNMCALTLLATWRGERPGTGTGA